MDINAIVAAFTQHLEVTPNIDHANGGRVEHQGLTVYRNDEDNGWSYEIDDADIGIVDDLDDLRGLLTHWLTL